MANFLLVGCGEIGAALGQQLISDGHQCTGLRRQVNQLPAGIQPLPADITQPATLQSLPGDLDFVVCTLVPAAADEAGYRATYIDGLKNLVQALHQQQHSLKRLLFVSSTSVYNQSHGEWVDEYSDTSPDSHTGQVMLEAERLAQQSGFPCTRVRFSGIYGGSDNRLLRWVREGGYYPRGAAHYSNRIHQEDCVGVLKHLIDISLDNRFPEDIYLASDCHPASYAEICQWLQQRLQLPTSATGFDLSTRLRAGSKRCSNQRLITGGYEFRHPDYRQGYEAILAKQD